MKSSLGLRLGLLVQVGDAGFVQAACIHELQRGVQLSSETGSRFTREEYYSIIVIATPNNLTEDVLAGGAD
jgi:hypothetical protein